jgi:hypothetical protein
MRTFPVRCNRDVSFKTNFEKYSSIPVGRILHLDWRGCIGSPEEFRNVYYTNVVCSLMEKRYSVKVENRVRYPQTTNATWCNGNTFFSLSF